MSINVRNLPSLTAGRGIAAMCVVLFHACLYWGGVLLPVADLGWIGVSFFYVLSGFVLTWAFRADGTPGEFYIHRLARIYPVHFITLCISVAAYVILRRPVGGYVSTPLATLANLALVQDWGVGQPEVRQGWNGVAWSLSAEFFFYLLTPSLIPNLAKLASRFLVTLCLVIFVVHLAIGTAVSWFDLARLEDFMIYHPLARLPEFIYGIATAVLFKRGMRLHLAPITKICTLLPLVFCWVVLLLHNPLLAIDLGVPAFCVLVVCGASGDLERRLVTPRGLRTLFVTIGESSYSLYMTHAIVLGFCALFLRDAAAMLPPSSREILFLVVSVIISIAFARAVEVPLRRAVLHFFGTRKRHTIEIESGFGAVP